MPNIRVADLETLPRQQLAREAMRMRNRAIREKNKADNFWEALGSYGVGGGAGYIGGRIAGAAQAEWEQMVAKYQTDKGVDLETAEKDLADKDPRTFIGIPKDLAFGIALAAVGIVTKRKELSRPAQWIGHGMISGALHNMGMDQAYDAAMKAGDDEAEAA